MSEKACRDNNISCHDETFDEEQAYRFRSENSEVASWFNSEAEGHPKEGQGELQRSSEKSAEGWKQKGRAGTFNRLRKRLKTRFEQLPGKWTSSSVRATSTCSDEDVRGEGTCMVRKQRAPRYRCVPNPPGCIPVEIMIRVEDVLYAPPLNRSGESKGSAGIEGTSHRKEINYDDDRNRSKNGQESIAFSPDFKMCKVNRPTKMLINNWIDPEQDC